MKIAHIVSTYPPYFGGMGNVVFQTAQALGDRGHDVEVFTPGYYPKKEIRPKEVDPVRTHEPMIQEQIDYARRFTPALQYGNAAYIPQIQDELDAFDIVHLHYPFFGTANLVRKWKIRNQDKPLVITYHMDTRAGGWKGLVFKYYSHYWMPKILGSADALIASSFDFLRASNASALFETNPTRWHELPFGVDTNRFHPDDSPAELFDQWQLDETVPTVLFVGGMDPAHYFKGVPVLLHALSILQKDGLGIQAVLVGDGSLRTSFEQTAEMLGLGNMVRFVGAVDDDELPTYYQMGDLLILPSLNQSEAFGMVLLEAFASGVPVIATNLPGVRTVAERAGIIVPPNNPVALAGAIIDFFSKENNQASWRARAREVAENIYSWEHIVESLEEIYHGLV